MSLINRECEPLALPWQCAPARKAGGSGGFLTHLFGLCSASDVSTILEPVAQEQGRSNWVNNAGHIRWQHSDERFVLSTPSPLRGLVARKTLCVLEKRLHLLATDTPPAPTTGTYFFTLDKLMHYVPFCADFGPYNLGMTHHFCQLLTRVLVSSASAGTGIVYYTSTKPTDITNAIYLLGAFLVLCLEVSPQDALEPFRNLLAGPSVVGFRDATWMKSSFDLSLLDTWTALADAVRLSLYDARAFNEDEYFYYDQPLNGDMHEVVKGKFIAFKGPVDRQPSHPHPPARSHAPQDWLNWPQVLKSSLQVAQAKHPSDFIDVFRVKDVRIVIRLNSHDYDKSVFTNAGFQHHDLFFSDCSVPSDDLVDQFLRIAEAEDTGLIAVHCLAGLGRTGTLIGLWMMKRYRMTARATMAWLRISRPGSVIGPQQAFLVEQQERMWQLGLSGVAGLGNLRGANGGAGGRVEGVARKGMDRGGMEERGGKGRDTRDRSDQEDRIKMAEMVAKGMNLRDSVRLASQHGCVHHESGGRPSLRGSSGQSTAVQRPDRAAFVA